MTDRAQAVRDLIDAARQLERNYESEYKSNSRGFDEERSLKEIDDAWAAVYALLSSPQTPETDRAQVVERVRDAVSHAELSLNSFANIRVDDLRALLSSPQAPAADRARAVAALNRAITLADTPSPLDAGLATDARSAAAYIAEAGLTVGDLRALLSAPQTPAAGEGWSISTDGEHAISDRRRWLARQLMDSKLSEDEALGVVSHHPALSPSPTAGEELTDDIELYRLIQSCPSKRYADLAKHIAAFVNSAHAALSPSPAAGEGLSREAVIEAVSSAMWTPYRPRAEAIADAVLALINKEK